MKKFLRFGHRGAPGYPRFGENTMPSFRKAIETGADGLETDIRKTKDGVLVLLHDRALERTTNGEGSVNDLTYTELRQLKTDNSSYIPTLEEFLGEFGGHGQLFLELKEGGITPQVKEKIIGFNLTEDAIVIAFDEDDRKADASSSWEDLKPFPSEIKIGLLATREKAEKLGKERFIETAKRLNAYSIHPCYDAIVPSFIDLVEMTHKAGLRVFTWTLNKTKDIEKAKEIGVDGIFSDLPELLS